MPRSANPVPQYFTAENKILSGGLMFYFEVGTSEPKETFANFDETIPNTHPVVLDSEGRLPNVFFSGTAKQVLKDANSVQIWERDNVGDQDVPAFNDADLQFFSTTQNMIDNFTKTPTLNDIVQTLGFTVEGVGGAPWQFKGVTGQTPSQSPGQLIDGKFNDPQGNQWALVVSGPVDARALGLTGAGTETAVLKAIAAGIQDNQEVFFSIDFAIDERIDFTTSCTVDFKDIDVDATGLPNSTVDRDLNIAFRFSGTIDSAEAITSDLSVGDESFQTATPTMSKGDTVIIQSDQLFVDGWTGSSSNKRGEIVTVKSVSGTTVNFNEALYFSYLSASNLTATKVNTIAPKIKGGTINMGGVNSEHRGINLNHCRDASVIGTTVDGGEDYCFTSQFNHSCKFDIVAMNATIPTSGFNTGYGISVNDGSRNIDVQITGYNCKHVVTGGSSLPAQDVTINGIAYDSGLTSTSWDCHEPCFNWTWDVESIGGNAGIGIRGSDQYVKIKCRDQASNAVRIQTFDTVPLQYNIHVDVDVKRCGSSAVTFDTTFNPIENVSVKLNGEDITLDGVGAVGNVTNKITNLTLDLNIDGTTVTAVTAIYVDDLIINMDRVANLGDRAGRFENCNDVKIEVGNAISTTAQVFRFEDCTDVEISGQKLISSANSCISSEDCTNIKLSVGYVESTGGTQDGWRAVNTIGASIIGTKFVSGRHAVFSSGTSDKFVCTSNDVTDVANATEFNLSGASNVDANNLS